MDKKRLLKKCSIFSKAPSDLLEQIGDISYLRDYKKGSYVFSQDEPGDTMYVVGSGLVKISVAAADGREKTLDILKSGDFFGEMALLDESPRSASAVIIEDSTLLVIYRKDFFESVVTNPQLVNRVLLTFVKRLREADAQISDLAFQSVAGRIARALMTFGDKFGQRTEKGQTITIRLTHQDLAELVGTSRETATKALGKFRDEGSIETTEQSIVIVDEAKLKDWIV